jgi:hypothetical protein
VTTTMEREEEQVRELFEQVDGVLEVAHSIEHDRPAEAEKLHEISRRVLESAAPIRVQVAANILLVSHKTVRAWVDDGLLTLREGPRRVLDAMRLHDVLQLVHDLRAAGRSRDLRSALWERLEDDAMLQRDDLAESLKQLRRGKLVPARTRDEELADAGRR